MLALYSLIFKQIQNDVAKSSVLIARGFFQVSATNAIFILSLVWARFTPDMVV